MIGVYTRIGTFRVAARYTTWIFRVINRQCRRLAREAAKYVAEFPSGDSLARDAAVDVDRVDLLVPAIATSTVDLRAVSVLRHIEDHDTATTAASLRISESNWK